MKNILNAARFALTIMLMIALTMGTDLTACAAADSASLDLAQSGSVSLTMKSLSGEVLTDGAVTLYQVAVLSLNNGDMVYSRTEAFADCAQALDVDDSSLAAVLAEYVIDNGIRGTEVFIGPDGTASFDNLNLGLYLVVQTAESAGYSAVLPFLVTIPYAENGTWIYDVDASPKVEPSFESEEPETPAGSDTPESPSGIDMLPQTGQMNWPIPLLAFGGLLFLAMGWFLFTASGKEESHAA